MKDILILLLVTICVAQCAYIVALQRTAFGIYSSPALRLRLILYSLLKLKCSVIAIDIRKMHELNLVLGYSTTNSLLGRLLTVVAKNKDLVGQFGGDEFIIVSLGEGNADVIVRRLLAKKDELSAKLTYEQKSKLERVTGNLVSGLELAISYVDFTENAYKAAKTLIDRTEIIKIGGVESTDRALVGRQGTLIDHLTVLE